MVQVYDSKLALYFRHSMSLGLLGYKKIGDKGSAEKGTGNSKRDWKRQIEDARSVYKRYNRGQ